MYGVCSCIWKVYLVGVALGGIAFGILHQTALHQAACIGSLAFFILHWVALQTFITEKYLLHERLRIDKN
jgi:hypothetical protein